MSKCNDDIKPTQLFKGEIQNELSENIAEKVITHRNNFRNLLRGKFYELLPLCLTYKNIKGIARTIDFLKLEVALRSNVQLPVIGQGKNGYYYFCGYTANWQNMDNPESLFLNEPLTEKDITFFMKRNLFPKYMKQITELDDCQTGNFIVLKNKVVQFSSDFSTINHYADVLAEIEVTRFSLTLQARVNTFFYGEADDLTMNQLIGNVYNGQPYTKVSRDFDIEDSVYTMDNSNLAQNLSESKREYQNRLSELCSMIGINSLGVDKTSGVSDIEAKSNSAFITPIANSYISSRQEPLFHLYKRHSEEMDLIKVFYNDEVISEIMLKGGVKNGENNDNTFGDNS